MRPNDKVVLAVPARQAATILPGLKTPTQFVSILNAHFRCEPPPGTPPILGVVNGLVEWIFPFKERLSITISAADRLMNAPREQLAQDIWNDVCAATGATGELPRWQIVRERRATFAATPEQDALRPGTVTEWKNLVLAGDWTATGLPSTIEGSIRSGDKAADHIIKSRLNAMNTATATTPASDALQASIAEATRALHGHQQRDGHWVFELEADATIPSEYILFRHYLGEPVDSELERKIANYLMRIQGAHGGWPLFQDGAFDMSASVKAYFALKMIGHDIDAPHMKRAREAILVARRRGEGQRVHPLPADVLRTAHLAQRAGAADRDHAAAALVAVSPEQGLVLGAHHHRAADGARRAEAARAQSERRAGRRAVPRGPGDGRHAVPRAASEQGAGSRCSAASMRSCA